MKKREVISVLLAATMVVGMVSGCGGSKESAGTDGKEEAKGKVYYLNYHYLSGIWSRACGIYVLRICKVHSVGN